MRAMKEQKNFFAHGPTKKRALYILMLNLISPYTYTFSKLLVPNKTRSRARIRLKSILKTNTAKRKNEPKMRLVSSFSLFFLQSPLNERRILVYF